jgi:hypothetical protein
MRTVSLVFIFLSLLFLFVHPAFTETSSIEVESSRHLKEGTGTESFVNITLNYSFTENIVGLIITERIPSDFKFVNSYSNPPASAVKTNETTNEVKWLFISLEQKKELTIQYTLEVPINFNENTYTIEGYWKAVSTETEATGISPTTTIQEGTSTTTTVEEETSTTTTIQEEKSINSTISIHIITSIGAVLVAAVIIVVILARRHSFARG